VTQSPKEVGSLASRFANGKNRLLTGFLPFEHKTRIWEFVAALPFDLRLHGGQLKALLRVLVRQCFSKNVAWRRKRRFSIPVHRWLISRWQSVAETVWRESLLDKEGWICALSMLTQLELAIHRGWAPPQLWYLFVFELWLRYEQNNLVFSLF